MEHGRRSSPRCCHDRCYSHCLVKCKILFVNLFLEASTTVLRGRQRRAAYWHHCLRGSACGTCYRRTPSRWAQRGHRSLRRGSVRAACHERRRTAPIRFPGTCVPRCRTLLPRPTNDIGARPPAASLPEAHGRLVPWWTCLAASAARIKQPLKANRWTNQTDQWPNIKA